MILNFSHVFCSITFLREIAYILEICIARKLEQTTHNKLNEKVLVHDVEHGHTIRFEIFIYHLKDTVCFTYVRLTVKRKLFYFKKEKKYHCLTSLVVQKK